MKGTNVLRLNELQQGLETARSQYGHEALEVVTPLKELGDFYFETGNVPMAYEAYAYALQIIERAKPSSQANGVELLRLIASVGLSRGDTARSIEALERASLLAEQVYGKSNEEYFNCLLELGKAWYQEKRPERAKPYLKRCIQRFEAIQACPKLDQALGLLASCYEDTGEIAKALPLLERSLDIRVTAHGKEHLNTGVAMRRLAAALKNAGRLDEADQLLISALPIFESALPQEDPLLLSIRSELLVQHTSEIEAHV